VRKVFKNCYEMDRRCYDEYGLTEDILMEHAADGMLDYISSMESASSILIVSGAGNNGADGMVLARLLQFSIRSVKLFVPFGAKSDMAKRQLARVKNLDYVEIVDELSEADIVVDAIFGAGLSRPLDAKTQNIVNAMNDLNGFKLACDIPTGIDEDGQIDSIAFCADATVTMGARKESLYADGVKDIVGEIIRVDLGIRYNQYTKDMPVSSYLLDREDLELPSRDFSMTTHKGSFGHAVIFCGDKEGAGIMAGMTASRFGAGLTTLISHEKISPPPYLMHSTEIPQSTTAIAIGMGLGGYFDEEFLQQNVIDSHLPIVLDADALGQAKMLEILKQNEREIVITPHPKEFTVLWEILTRERLSVEEIQANRFDIVRRFNSKYPHVALLLKGANMLIAHEEKLYINALGSARLSKGGSGDVLSGLIVALLAQGHTAVDATIQGSLALAISAENYKGSSYAMLPTDIIEQVSLLEARKG